MKPAPSRTPPSAALWLLDRVLPAAERDLVIGDVTELFADRVDAGRPFNRAWCWVQTAALVFGLGPPSSGLVPAARPPGSRVMRIGGRISVTWTHAVRRLRYEWRYALGVVLILGIGIGPATTMLSIVQHVLLHPLAYQDPDRLGIVRINLGQIQNHPGLAPGEVIDLRHTAGLFAGVEAEARQFELSLNTGEALVPLSAVSMTTGLLPMLGVVPILGRPFTEEDVHDPLGVVLLDYGTWRSRFGGDRTIVGRRIVLNNNPIEVIGVLPSGFRLATGRAVPAPIDVYLPMRVTMFRNFWGYPTLVRLAPGVSFDHVNTALTGLAASLVKAYPEAYAGVHLAVLRRAAQRRHGQDHASGVECRDHRRAAAPRHCHGECHRPHRRPPAYARTRLRHPLGGRRKPRVARGRRLRRECGAQLVRSAARRRAGRPRTRSGAPGRAPHCAPVGGHHARRRRPPLCGRPRPCRAHHVRPHPPLESLAPCAVAGAPGWLHAGRPRR